MDTRKNAVPPFWMALAKRLRFAPPCYVALSMAVLLIFTAPAPAQIVTATVRAAGTPVAATVNPDTNKIYIANQLGQNVQVINGATNSSTVINTPGKGPRLFGASAHTQRRHNEIQNIDFDYRDDLVRCDSGCPS